MEKELNEQDSLRLITEMITQARSNFQKGRGDGIVFWGYTIAIIALANFVLLQIFGYQPAIYWVWALTIPIFIIHYVTELKRGKKALAKNGINEIIGHVWFAYAISSAVFVASIFITGIWDSVVFLLINPALIGMSGLCIYVTGRVCRFKPFVYGAYAFWCGALISAAIPVVCHAIDFQFLILALCMLVGFVIPGHILNRKSDQNV
jgi:hypothetical protein